MTPNSFWIAHREIRFWGEKLLLNQCQMILTSIILGLIYMLLCSYYIFIYRYKHEIKDYFFHLFVDISLWTFYIHHHFTSFVMSKRDFTILKDMDFLHIYKQKSIYTLVFRSLYFGSSDIYISVIFQLPRVHY